ncbi:MAG: hypothetical protein R2752_04550 [Vicinamibacterales bacterium]
MAKHGRPKVSSASTRSHQPAQGSALQPKGPTPEAVRAFDAAMRALQAHEYQQAAGLFEALIQGHATERALLDRARVYIDLCQRELRRARADGLETPDSIEERLAAATAALNLGREDETERLANAVLRDDPDQELALYLLAAVEARRGRRDDALSRLAKAIQISPEVRAQARHDDDFEILREMEAFKLLTEGPAPS